MLCSSGFLQPSSFPIESELPRTGMLAHFRNRLGVIAAVELYNQPEQFH